MHRSTTRRSAAAAISVAVLLLATSGCGVIKKPLAFLVPSPPPRADEPHFRSERIRPAPWALVLSDGAMRGFAHVGVLRELEAAGLRPDLIVGVSSGAIVGALAASGLPASELEQAAMGLRANIFWDWTVPYTGLLEGEGIHAFVDSHLRAHRIEDFPIRFAAVAAEAETGCLQIFNAGDAGRAAQASSSVPVLLAPPAISGKRYLDGGIVSPLPVRVARMLGAERVVAVDVTFPPSERPFLNITDAFWRTTLVMHRALAAIEGAEADLVIAPRLPPEFLISLRNRPAIIDSGARAAREALPALRLLIGRSPESRTSPLPQMLCPSGK